MRLLSDVILTLGVVAAFVLVLEGALRLAGVNYDASFYSLDRDLGYALRPNARGWNVKENENYERISSQGLRDREHTLSRPPNVIRIAVVGDSFAEAKQVQLEAAYWSVMERELNARLAGSGVRVEVVNFGIAGYGLAQNYLVIKQKVWQYDPQIVMLSGSLHSLILTNSRKFGTTTVGGGPIPYFVYSGGQLALDATTERERRLFVQPGRLTDLMGDLTNESRVLSLINATRRVMATDVRALRRGQWHSTAEAAAADAPSYEDLVLKGPVTADLADAWAVFEALLSRSHEETLRHHAEFWFFLIDMSPQIDPDPDKRAATRRVLGIDDLFLTDRRIGEFAHRQGISHELLAAPMLAYAEEHHAVLHGFPGHPRNSGHWTELGHAVAGHLMAERLFGCSLTIRAVRGPVSRADESACEHAERQQARLP